MDEMTTLFEDLVPIGVSVAEDEIPSRASARDASYPIEWAAVESSCPSRKAEFLAGRALARRAIKASGSPQVPLPRDADGCCVWPPGLVGSISHSRRRCAVAVADAERFGAIGIDVEESSHWHDRVGAMVTRPDEIQPAGPPGTGSCSWQLIRFSAKESVFKAWFAQFRTWLDFGDVVVEFDPGSASSDVGAFRAEVRPGGTASGAAYRGRYGVHSSGYVATVALPDMTTKRQIP